MQQATPAPDAPDAHPAAQKYPGQMLLPAYRKYSADCWLDVIALCILDLKYVLQKKKRFVNLTYNTTQLVFSNPLVFCNFTG